jgi:hypothetical protein
MFEVMFFACLLGLVGLGACGGYTAGRRRNTKVASSASANKPSVPCDKCGPHGVIDQYHWNFCCKCGRELHTAHVG